METMREHEGQPVRAFVVWLPMVKGDSESAARDLLAATADSRVRGYWDPKGRSGKAFSKTLDLRTFGFFSRTAWDVYLVYPPGVRWAGDQPPRPAHWEHQLAWAKGAQPGVLLDRERLTQEVGRALQEVRAPALW
jgi:hypothetical protein